MANGAEYEVKVGWDKGRAGAEIHNGSRASLLDTIGVPKGWVLDGTQGDEFWSKVKKFAMPLKPGSSPILFDREAKKYLERAKKALGEDIVMTVLRDDEAIGGFSAHFVKLADLNEPPAALLRESVKAVMEGNNLLAESKKQAYMLLTGQEDTK